MSYASVKNLGSKDPKNVEIIWWDDFDDWFRTVEDEHGNEFVCFPKMYRRIDKIQDGQITDFTMSFTKEDENFEPYSVFVRPDGSEMPYVLIGKYLSGGYDVCESKKKYPVWQTIGNARDHARALGKGYQLYDWQFQKLFQDLALVAAETVDFQNGSETIAEYLGVHQLDWGCWVDGVAADNGKWLIASDPAYYISHPTEQSEGYKAVYTCQDQTGVVMTLGFNEQNPFFNYPVKTEYNNAYRSNTYYCDMYHHAYGNRPVYSDVGRAYSNSGLFYCDVDINWVSTGGVRICYRPL